MQGNRVVVVGSLNVDLTAKTQRLPQRGETIASHDFHTFPGGKGANQSVAAAKLGAAVVHVGRVGDDTFADLLIASLKGAGVNTSKIARAPQTPTGTALITVDSVGDNTIVVVPGANGRCDSDYVAAALTETEADVMVLQLEIPMEAVVTAARIGRQRGMQAILNPAPAAPLPKELWEYVDLLVVNETEAQLLAGIEVTDADSATEAAQVLLAKGVGQVVVTLGSQGALYLDGDRRIDTPAFPVKSVDSTAAGDAFVGGLAATIGSRPIENVMEFAAAAGALTVTKLGAQSSLPSKEEVEVFLANQKQARGQ